MMDRFEVAIALRIALARRRIHANIDARCHAAHLCSGRITTYGTADVVYHVDPATIETLLQRTKGNHANPA